MRSILSISIVCCLVMTGCATLPAVPLNEKEIAIQEIRIGHELAREFETHIKKVHDKNAEKFLDRIGQRLVDVTPELKYAPFEVILFRQRSNHGWRNYGLPGNRVYLSVELLKPQEGENEYAAAIAVELGRLAKKNVLKRLEKSTVPDHFGSESVFSGSNEDEQEAARVAVGILYRAGYDPRGIESYYIKCSKPALKFSLSEKLLSEVIEVSRREVAMYSPLRNPVLKSEGFDVIRQGILRL